jgi:hypothetical protein
MKKAWPIENAQWIAMSLSQILFNNIKEITFNSVQIYWEGYIRLLENSPKKKRKKEKERKTDQTKENWVVYQFW